MPKKLGLNNLKDISAAVVKPSYSRDQIKNKIAHIGVGAFHRAHQAVYLDDLLSKDSKDGWGIVGIGILEGDSKIEKALKEQDFLYTVIERDAKSEKARVIASIIDFVNAYQDRAKAIEALSSPDVKIVSLTITEGGYCYNQGNNRLDREHATIKHDLANPSSPTGTFGYIAAALKARKEKGIPPFTILSCDNIQKNGDLTRSLVTEFISVNNPELAEWVQSSVAFPNSMVDRITPATTPEHIKHLEEKYDLSDQWPVCCETFLQWVVEDEFCNGRPGFEKVGVQLTKDVEPYEKMKIRLLNASHSAMGYLGYLAGFRYIDQIASDAEFKKYVRGMMDQEVTSTLDDLPDTNLDQYKDILQERFSNPNIKDTAARICMDGSGKIPKFILPTIRDRIAEGKSIDRLSLVVASWVRYLNGKDEEGNEIVLQDPMAKELQEKAIATGKDAALFLAQEHIFGDLAKSKDFYLSVQKALESLHSVGARKTLQNYLS